MAALAQKRKVSAPRRKSRRNPAGAAAEMFEKFTGQESTGVEEYVESEHYHGNLAQLGVLVELKVRTVNGDKVVLGFDPEDRTENPKRSRDDEDIPASWVIIEKSSGKAVRETFTKKVADAINKDKYKAVPIQEYLGGLNTKKNPWWPFDGSFDKTTIYHVKTGAKHSSSAKHKGYTIYKAADGTFIVPALDRESHMDTAKDAKKFIDAWSKKNPGPIASTFGKAQAQGGKLFKYVDGQLGKIGGKLLKKNPGSGPTLLCSSESGDQLFIIGGRQDLNLEDLGITGREAEKESIVVGSITHLVYRAKKKFDDFKELEYIHTLSEDTKGPLPMLIYDRPNEALSIAGGCYFIKKPLLGVSPGIEN